MIATVRSSRKHYTHIENFMTSTGTFYDQIAGIRPLFYNVNLGIAYDINGDGNILLGSEHLGKVFM
jgi:hypothetical protein